MIRRWYNYQPKVSIWDILLFRKPSLWGCYNPRHVTKQDVLLLATMAIFSWSIFVRAVIRHMTCYNLNWPKISALFCLFLCFRSYPKKLEVYSLIFYKIIYILEELYAAVMWIISRLIIYIDQQNTGHMVFLQPHKCIVTIVVTVNDGRPWAFLITKNVM